MSFEEMFGDEESANDYELGTLYAQTKTWLEANTPLFVEQIDDIAGTYNDLPITQHNPHYAFEIPGSILRNVVPEAAVDFDDDDTLNLMYFVPHYVMLPEHEFDDDAVAEYQYQQPQCCIEIERANDPSYGVSIIIEDAYGEGNWQVVRIFDADLELDDEIRENPEGILFIDAEQFENKTVFSRMTKREYDLFSSIASKLDELKAMMPDPPLYIPEDPS